jgi:hypothetical protein
VSSKAKKPKKKKKKAKAKKPKKKKKKAKAKNRELLKYVLDSKSRQRVGVVVAVERDDGSVSFGWSQCMVSLTRVQRHQGIKEPDRFDKETGKNKARGRADQKLVGLTPDGKLIMEEAAKIPNACATELRESLIPMASRYFKGKKK